MTANLGPPTDWSPPPDDQRRLQALRRYRILDSLPGQAFEDVVQLATTICGTPRAVVTFVDEDRQWFKASHGIDGEETERSMAFCDIAIRRPDEVTIVNDASQHPVFRHYPQVTGDDHLRFYAGAPMVTRDGYALGSVCVVDVVPREISLEEFLVLMPATPPDGAITVVERIRETVAGHPDLPVPVTLSAGIASGQAGRDDTESVFERADQALYQAKRRGRDRIVVADD